MASPRNRERLSHDAAVIRSGGSTTISAIELLKSDHRQVEAWFDAFFSTDDGTRRRRLATDIGKALTVHMRIEEEVFYPALVEVSGRLGMYHDAVGEHAAVKDLIRDMGSPPDEGYDPRMRALERLVRHHVAEEEKPGGMFEAAAASGLDLHAVGARLEQRKLQLMDDAESDQGYDEAVQRAGGGSFEGP